jgi:hypothetical protein
VLTQIAFSYMQCTVYKSTDSELLETNALSSHGPGEAYVSSWSSEHFVAKLKSRPSHGQVAPLLKRPLPPVGHRGLLLCS